jgi:NitT/TauT family transport system permease protein
LDIWKAREMNVRRKRAIGVRLGTLSVPVLIIAFWQFSSMVIGELALPLPSTTLGVLKDGLVEGGWLLSNLKDTMTELLLGYLLAVILGLVVGFILGMQPFAREVLEPFVLNIYAIPKVTLFPIFLFIFGLGMESKVAFGFFHGIFPIIILTMSSIKDIKGVYIKVGRSFRLNSLKIFKEIVFPSILPSLMTGLRLGFNLSFLGVILGEMAASRSGLGYELMKSEGAFYMEKILSIILVLAVIAMAVNFIYYALERKLGRVEESRVVEDLKSLPVG